MTSWPPPAPSQPFATETPRSRPATCVEFVAGPLADNPHRLGKPLLGPPSGHHGARRGSYRVIYVIDDDNRRVDVVHIDHRTTAYR
ncbi:MAG: type II toxin-antitoxin system RelE family toxin [Pseudonocardia sp.]